VSELEELKAELREILYIRQNGVMCQCGEDWVGEKEEYPRIFEALLEQPK